MQLGGRAAAAGWRHSHVDRIGSTNAEALARAEAGLWVSAGEQSSGRGRRGRSWASPPGNLYASLVLRPPGGVAQSALLCFVSALAVSDAIRAAAPNAGRALALKWPNDVLIAGAKTAGILIEGSHGREGFIVVIGCGINVAHSPSDTPYKATHLAATDGDVDLDRLFANLTDAMADRLAQFAEGAGFASIRQDWLSRAAGIGSVIGVRLAGGEVSGRFEGIGPDGALILGQPDGGRRLIAAGEIVLEGKRSLVRRGGAAA